MADRLTLDILRRSLEEARRGDRDYIIVMGPGHCTGPIPAEAFGVGGPEVASMLDRISWAIEGYFNRHGEDPASIAVAPWVLWQLREEDNRALAVLQLTADGWTLFGIPLRSDHRIEAFELEVRQ